MAGSVTVHRDPTEQGYLSVAVANLEAMHGLIALEEAPVDPSELFS